MIRNHLLSFLLWFLGGGIAYCICNVKTYRKRTFIFFNELPRLLFVAYMFGIVSQLLLPRIRIALENIPGGEDVYVNIRLLIPKARYNIVPFSSIRAQLSGTPANQLGILNFMGNLLIFAPLGAFLPLLFNKRWCAVLAITFALSTCVEILQYFIGRTSDIDDIILNTAGSILGYCVYHTFKRIKQAWQSKSL